MSRREQLVLFVMSTEAPPRHFDGDEWTTGDVGGVCQRLFPGQVVLPVGRSMGLRRSDWARPALRRLYQRGLISRRMSPRTGIKAFYRVTDAGRELGLTLGPGA